jgi:hypothetical protein
MNTLLHSLLIPEQSDLPLKGEIIEAKELIFGALNPNTHVY